MASSTVYYMVLTLTLYSAALSQNTPSSVPPAVPPAATPVTSVPVTSVTVLHLEPPYCNHDVILDHDEEVILESSNRTSVYNQNGDCSVTIENRNQSKHILYQFELGPNITDCSVELVFNDGVVITNRAPTPRYTCDNIHSSLHAHSDNYTGKVSVIRPYVTLRKDFFFRIRVVQIEPWDDHVDNGLGLFVDKSIQNPGIPLVLYTILALDFLIPTLIFVINECSGRIEATRKKEDTTPPLPSQQDDQDGNILPKLSPHIVLPNSAADTENYVPIHKNAAVGLERQAAFQSSIPTRKGVSVSAPKLEVVSPNDVLLFPYLISSGKSDKPNLLKLKDTSRGSVRSAANSRAASPANSNAFSPMNSTAASPTSSHPAIQSDQSNRRVAFQQDLENKTEIGESKSQTYRRKITQQIKFSKLKGGSKEDTITEWANEG